MLALVSLQRGAEALLVLGIVDPARFPGVARLPLQVAENLGAANELAAFRLVAGVLEPDHAPTDAIAAGRNFDRALAGVIDPQARHVGGRSLRGDASTQQRQRHKRRARGPGSLMKIKDMHREMPSLRQVRSRPPATCNRYAEKMRQLAARTRAASAMDIVKHEGIGRTRRFTFPAAKSQDEHKCLYNERWTGWLGVRMARDPAFLDRATCTGRLLTALRLG